MLNSLLLIAAILLGHFGWWLACYNRLNALAIPRRTIKRIERVLVLLSVLLPWCFVFLDRAEFSWSKLFHDAPELLLSGRVPVLSAWSALSLISLAMLGPEWLESRLWLFPPKNLRDEKTTRFRTSDVLAEPVTVNRLSKLCNRLPGNEITHLTLTEKTIALEMHRARSWSRVRIGHLSDLHFTGQLSRDFYRFALDKLSAAEPDIIVLTGDIIDKDHCLPWIGELLHGLQAPMGKFFLIGNHEQRVSHVSDVIERMIAANWFDLGTSSAVVDPVLPGQPRIRLFGNELPWYRRNSEVPAVQTHSQEVSSGEAAGELLLGAAHTPDQFPWARRLRLDLLLAGHTHGGQVRFPLIGPIVAPSRQGSRFASGVFRLPPTVMHVSRGLAGCHPLRWRCPPEVAVLDIVTDSRD